jgi:hypothetical protein
MVWENYEFQVETFAKHFTELLWKYELNANTYFISCNEVTTLDLKRLIGDIFIKLWYVAENICFSSIDTNMYTHGIPSHRLCRKASKLLAQIQSAGFKNKVPTDLWNDIFQQRGSFFAFQLDQKDRMRLVEFLDVSGDERDFFISAGFNFYLQPRRILNIVSN